MNMTKERPNLEYLYISLMILLSTLKVAIYNENIALKYQIAFTVMTIICFVALELNQVFLFKGKKNFLKILLISGILVWSIVLGKEFALQYI